MYKPGRVGVAGLDTDTTTVPEVLADPGSLPLVLVETLRYGQVEGVRTKMADGAGKHRGHGDRH